MPNKSLSPLRRWLRTERVRDWPEEAERQKREIDFVRQGWTYEDQGGGWWRRVDRNGDNVDVYYIGSMTWAS